MGTDQSGARSWWFETSRFENAPEVEQEVNPGRFGESLAKWLAAELGHRGWDVVDVFGEDWGWVVRVQRDGAAFFVNCGNEDGSTLRWLVGIEAHVGLLQRIFAKSRASSGVEQLDADVERIISSDGRTTWHGRDQPE